MFIGQEIWYITKGNYQHKRSLFIVYSVTPDRGRDIYTIVDGEFAEEARKNVVCFLPSLEVVPSQFKIYHDKMKDMDGSTSKRARPANVGSLKRAEGDSRPHHRGRRVF